MIHDSNSMRIAGQMLGRWPDPTSGQISVRKKGQAKLTKTLRIEPQKIVPTQVPKRGLRVENVVTCWQFILGRAGRSHNHWQQVPTQITWHPGREDGGMRVDAIGSRIA